MIYPFLQWDLGYIESNAEVIKVLTMQYKHTFCAFRRIVVKQKSGDRLSQIMAADEH